MSIRLQNMNEIKDSNTPAELFADTKAEILAEDATVLTTNAGLFPCQQGASCITAAGELCFMNSSGVWAEVV
jgi:hypothetical protein